MKNIKFIYKDGWDIQIANNRLYFREDYTYNNTDKYYEYDLQTIRKIEKDEFLLAKFGKNYKKIIEIFGDEPASVEKLPDGTVIATEYIDFYIHIFDKDGNLLQKLDTIGFDSIYGIAFEPPDYLWCAIPTANAIRKYRLSDSKEMFGIGFYGENEVLDLPEDVDIYDNFLYISDLNHNRICKLDLQTYQTETYIQFDECKPFAYKRIGDVEFIESSDGIYEVRNE